MKNTLKRMGAAAALAVAGVAAATGSAAAHDNGDSAPHSQGTVGFALVNGDVSVADDACVAPWHWDGPVQVLTDSAPYQACQDEGGTQHDAPAVDVHHNHHNGGHGLVPFL